MGNYGKLTVFFEDPFWVGVFERLDGDYLTAAKVTFGAEPKDCEVYEFFLNNHSSLPFSPAVRSETKDAATNPKRRQREIQKSLAPGGIGTKSQQALKLQQEQGKLARKAITREQRLLDGERAFALRQQKKKEKHRGH